MEIFMSVLVITLIIKYIYYNVQNFGRGNQSFQVSHLDIFTLKIYFNSFNKSVQYFLEKKI